jgi:pimeloyl-ACP methyl ester carboxylesterase
MKLEIISRGMRNERPSLLFVHGAFHSAACWDHHYLPWFEDQGWFAHAVSLRGHGDSAGNFRDNPGLADYVSDIKQAMDQIGGPIVVIGHSMGGVLAQMARARYREIVGAVFLASSPLRPDPLVVLRMFFRHPVALIRNQVFGDMEAGREAFTSFFFSPDLDPALKRKYVAELSGESYRAVKEVFSRSRPEVPDLKSRPVLVVAGDDDWSIPMKDNEKLARTFNAPLVVCPGAHDLMLDPNWQISANSIANWLSTTFPD